MPVLEKYSNRIPLSIPHMTGGELAEVEQAVSSGWVGTRGPALDRLEKEFSDLMHGYPCIGLNSGTSAIHLGLKLLGVGKDDEVVCQSLTFSASANPILYEGAQPVFVDSERRTWGMDPNVLEEVMKKKATGNALPRAVIVVHLFGQSVDLDSILSICNQYEVPVLEDAAESLGALYKGRHPGAFGEVSAFSFNGNKIITGSGGGILVTKHPEWVKRAQKLSTQARDQDPLGVANFVHSEVGYNYRLSTVLAGFISGQLKALEDRVLARRRVFDLYHEGFASVPGIEAQPEASYGSGEGATRHSRWLSAFQVQESEFGMSSVDLIKALNALNIESRPVWRPMHTQPLFSQAEYHGGRVSEELNLCGLCLPSSSNLRSEELEFVIDAVRVLSKSG